MTFDTVWKGLAAANAGIQQHLTPLSNAHASLQERLQTNILGTARAAMGKHLAPQLAPSSGRFASGVSGASGQIESPVNSANPNTTISTLLGNVTPQTLANTITSPAQQQGQAPWAGGKAPASAGVNTSGVDGSASAFSGSGVSDR